MVLIQFLPSAYYSPPAGPGFQGFPRPPAGPGFQGVPHPPAGPGFPPPPAGPGFQGFPRPPHTPLIPQSPHQHMSTLAENIENHNDVTPTQNANSAQVSDTQGGLGLFQPPGISRTQGDAEQLSAPSSSSLSNWEMEDRFPIAAGEEETRREEGCVQGGDGDANTTTNMDMTEIRQRRLERFHSAPVSSESSIPSTGDSGSSVRTADNEGTPPRGE